MSIEIANITMVATNVEAMLKFYNAVVDTNFQKSALIAGHQLYSGKLAGIPIDLCPNSLVDIVAEQNRQQFHFLVDDVRATMNTALANGGTELNSIQEQNGTLIASVYDPDHNSIVFAQQT